MPVDLTPLAGNADLVEEDASNLRTDAMRLGSLQELLSSLRIDGSGYAVLGLQRRIDETAVQVQHAFENYVWAYRSLDAYGPELRQAQKDFDAALERHTLATSQVETHEARHRELNRAAAHLRASGVPAMAITQVENEAYRAHRQAVAARERVEQAEEDIQAARDRYDAAAEAALAELRNISELSIDTGAYLDEAFSTSQGADHVPSTLSSTATPQQRIDDGGIDFSSARVDLLLAPAVGYAAGSSWVHQNTIVRSNGTVQWKPYNTLDRSSTGIFTQDQTRRLRSIYGSTGGQARSRYVIGPRASTVVSRGLSVFGAAWTFYDVNRNADTKYWYLAPEDRQSWATMEAAAVTTGSTVGGTGLAAAGAACGPLVVACAPVLGVGGGLIGGQLAERGFEMSTYNERNQLAAEHFTSTRPGTEVTDGKVYFEGKQIGYFGIHHE